MKLPMEMLAFTIGKYMEISLNDTFNKCLEPSIYSSLSFKKNAHL